jgi:transposase
MMCKFYSKSDLEEASRIARLLAEQGLEEDDHVKAVLDGTGWKMKKPKRHTGRGNSDG